VALQRIVPPGRGAVEDDLQDPIQPLYLASMFTKLLILLFVASTAAFVPAARRSVSTSMKMSFQK
jgi:hypothetical protein